MNSLGSAWNMLRRRRAPATAGDRTPRRSGLVPKDPFGLDGELFEYLCHKEQHGEAFVGYRVKGHAMVLISEGGTALASLHLRPAHKASGKALIARKPGDPTGFLGVSTVDGLAFMLVMTNLTTDGVMMMDIGGELRHREPQFWDRNDKTFWSGRHRNDRRLNRSNILWPMTPNVCEDSFMHYQQTGASRQLQLLSHTSRSSLTAGSVGSSGSGEGEGSFPLFVYPKYGSRAVSRFQKTVWACPESIIVVGTPALLDGPTEEHNIQLEHPLSRRPAQEGLGNWEAVVSTLADAFGVPPQRLLEVTRLSGDSLAPLPAELVHEVLVQKLSGDDIQALLNEGRQRDDSLASNHQAAAGVATPGTMPGSSATQQVATASQSSGDGHSLGELAGAATPAGVVAGRRLMGHGVSRLLIERFDFERASADARLHFGVHEKLQSSMAKTLVDAQETEQLKLDVAQQIDALRAGRRDVLFDSICSVYETNECVICLRSDPRPNCVLYQCGHRCLHLKCIESSQLRRCPVCRAPIAAVLPD
mmetsp:Transcript_76393/g.151108  ORF Transcript_76393/g.151108 Transcript_76393/m.151108 type:complete len:532 (+) Transcript_76393:65-1660(+)